jgi:hypothetical protein
MVLKFYQEAENVKKLVAKGEQFVQVTKGEKRGSIARVVDVKHIKYSHHQFKLQIDGCRKFWLKGKFLNHLPEYTGSTMLVKPKHSLQIDDILGKEIIVGCVIIFYKVIVPGISSIPELVVGTVKAIDINGNILVKPIIISGECSHALELLTLRNNRCLIINRNLLDDIMVYKLAH